MVQGAAYHRASLEPTLQRPTERDMHLEGPRNSSNGARVGADVVVGADVTALVRD